MADIKLSDVLSIVIDNMSEFSKSGFMASNGAYGYETPNEVVVIYNTGLVPYIIFQEEGFRHYLSGKMVTKNKGFISQRAQNKIDRYAWSNTLGLEYDSLDNNESYNEPQSKMLMQLGAVKNV